MLPMKPSRQLMFTPGAMIHDIRRERAPCGSRGLITRRLTRRPIVDVPSQGCGTTPPSPPFSMTQTREAPASVFRTMNPWIPTRARGCRVCQSDCRVWPVRNKLVMPAAPMPGSGESGAAVSTPCGSKFRGDLIYARDDKGTT